MKHLILAMLVFSTSLFAQEDLNKKIKALEEQRENALFQWRTQNRTDGKLPNPAYVEFYNKTWSDFALDEIDARKAACGRQTPNCLSEADQEAIKARVRIVTGLMTAKNTWATEGKTAAEIKTREDAYNNCAKENKDCDKLPEADRKTAREGQPDKPKTDVSPDNGGGSEVVVTPGGESDRKPADDAAAKKYEDAKKVAEEALEKEVTDLQKAFDEKHPGWRDKDMTAEVKDFLISQVNKSLELTLAMKKKLCEEHPGTDSCLTQEQIDALKDEAASTGCFLQRKFAKKTVSTENHKADWAALNPKECKTLLDKDQKPDSDSQSDNSGTVEEGDDEKTPRNYKSDTCKWVSDLPRKVVNGPGCGGKSRSRICTGYVVCEQKSGGGKFIRMSTCSPEHCGATDADAVNCTKDQRYFSQKPAGESKLFMSPKLKKILSGASEQ